MYGSKFQSCFSSTCVGVGVFLIYKCMMYNVTMSFLSRVLFDFLLGGMWIARYVMALLTLKILILNVPIIRQNVFIYYVYNMYTHSRIP